MMRSGLTMGRAGFVVLCHIQVTPVPIRCYCCYIHDPIVYSELDRMQKLIVVIAIVFQHDLVAW